MGIIPITFPYTADSGMQSGELRNKRCGRILISSEDYLFNFWLPVLTLAN